MEQKLMKRKDIDQRYTWRVEDIYPDDAAFEADLRRGSEYADRIASYEGRAAESPETLKQVMDLYEACLKTLQRYGVYAEMKNDEDTGNAAGQALNQRAQAESTKVSEKIAFLDPEILALGREKIEEYIRTPGCGLEKYAVTLREMVRLAPHTREKAAEKLLSSASDMAAVPYNAFSMLSNADMKFPPVTDADGNIIQISNGRFVPLEMSRNRALRKEVFEKFYGRYFEFRNTLAALYDGQIKQLTFYSKARQYGSNFEAAVDQNNVSPAVCDRLISSVHHHMDSFHRYVRLRKKLLGVEELHMYDVYVPMVEGFSVSVTYEQAQETALKALAPLGEEYLSHVREAFQNRWIDVCENEGKRSGAYSIGVYGVHPYMLLNFNGTLDDIFTLVHEMGHSIHTWYSDANQTFLNANYKIFVAEVASTTNEILLTEYLMGRAKSKKERAYLTNHLLESFKGTLYRQTMFEEFERKTSEMSEKGVPLTADLLSKTYLELNQQYFGPDMVSDPLIAEEWSRIPHFYYNFYVYQYATSFAAAAAIAERILREGAPAVEQYKSFLKSGCTSDPVSLLKIAGVDLSTEKPVEDALKLFDKALEDMEKLAE